MYFDTDDSKQEYRRLQVGSLFVPQDYQRDLDVSWVTQRIDKFSERKLGTMVVTPRGEGKYAVIDGQHRLALIRAAEAGGYPNIPKSVWCEIRIEEGRADEADLFLGRNDARPVHIIAKFKARIIAGEPMANQIKDILKEYGCQIGFPSKGTGNYACVNSIETVYGTDQLPDVIKIIERSWADRFGRIARSQVAVDGVALFHGTYHGYPEYSINRVIEKFSKVEKWTTLISQAKNAAAASGTLVKYQLALLLLERYNHGLKNRLPINDLVEKY